ncbi:MAG: methyltransferase domain-containing protein [Bacteroidetes bacterium]|nr:methyltransferase domain-containing protein [Bacteroidota bacterium]
MDFSVRSAEKELLDGDNIPLADLVQNLKELDFINTYLGGFNITLSGLSKLIKDKTKIYHIADIGCGGGDNLIAIAKWANKNNIKVQLTGIDMKNEAIGYAIKNCSKYPNIHFITSDYKLTQFKEPVDVIVSSLFCHHLNEQELVDCMVWMNQYAQVGFLINDLHRNKIAYYSIKWLTAVFSKSYLVKNDAAVSVSRGFIKSELEKLLFESGIKNYSIKWKWAFRYLILAKKSI